jgi:Tfp pilus assembly protein PilV
VEALVALVILALSVAAALEASSVTLRTQKAAERQLEAVALADAKMNELATLGPQELETYATPQGGTVELETRLYRWVAAARPDERDVGIWWARVRIEWTDGEFDLESAFYRPPRRGALGAWR